MCIVGRCGGLGWWSGLAGVFGGCSCERHVDFFLREVLRLKECDALFEGRACD